MSKKEDLAKEMRDPVEIIHAQKVLHAVLEGQIPLPYDPTSVQCMHVARDVLCWALCHNHPTEFGEFLFSLLQTAKANGFSFMDSQTPTVQPERLPGRWQQEYLLGKVKYAEAIEEIKAYHQGLFRSYRIKKGSCLRCGMLHSPHEPHDPSSKVFMSFTLATKGLMPTWEDAVADCPEVLQGLLVAELTKLNSYPNYSGLSPKITKAIKRCLTHYSKGK